MAAPGLACRPKCSSRFGSTGRPGSRLNSCSRYRSAESDAHGYADFVSGVVREIGPLIHVTSLQVTNEVNASLGIGASDGTQPGARSALVRGVIAAHAAMRIAGIDDRLKVGFSVALTSNPAATEFWRDLGRRGGLRFTEAVDWVGEDLSGHVGSGLWTRGISRTKLPAL